MIKFKETETSLAGEAQWIQITMRNHLTTQRNRSVSGLWLVPF